MFDIVVIGNYELILAVLNGVAMMFDPAGPAGPGSLIILGFSISILVTVGRSIATQRLEIHWIFVSWLIYSAMFVPKVTVTVEDIYTGTTNNVANVPLGLAAIGSITSSIGIGLADAFGAIFTVPSLTDEGYMDSLRILLSMRDMPYGDANDGNASGTTTNVDFQKTLNNYLKDCVLTEINSSSPTITMEQLRTTGNLLTDIQVNRPAWFTTVYLSGSAPEGDVANCQLAYAGISNFAVTEFMPAWNEYISDALGITGAVDARIQATLTELTGVAKNGQTFMLNSLISKELELAELGYHASASDTAGTIMRVQAMEQRRTQWAAEQTMFEEMARPLSAYIEAFFYAISPFMVFLITLGSYGITMFSKYLILAVWIQLWNPMMAINQLYLHIAAQQDLSSIESGGTRIESIIGLQSVWTDIQSWVAVGGLMAGMTPLLAFMIISGSYFAFTRMTDKMAGTDHINENVASPDIMRNSSVADVGGMNRVHSDYTTSTVSGMLTTNAQSVIPDFQASSMYSGMVSSASNLQSQSMQKWENAVGTTYSNMDQERFSAAVSELSKSGYSTSNSAVDQYYSKMADQVMHGAGFQGQEASGLKANIVNQMVGQIGASTPTKILDIGGKNSISTLEENSHQFSESTTRDLKTSYAKVAEQMESNKSELQEAVQYDAAQNLTSDIMKTAGVTSNEQWGQARSDIASASRTFNTANQLNDALGSTFSIDEADFGSQVLQRQGAQESLNQLVQQHNLSQQVDEQKGWYTRSNLIPNENQARAAASLHALSDQAQSGDINAANDLIQYLGDYGFISIGGLGDAYSNSGILTPDSGVARSEAELNIVEPSGSSSDFQSRVNTNREEVESIVQNGRENVSEAHSGFQSANRTSSTEVMNDMRQSRMETVAERSRENLSQDQAIWEVAAFSDVSRGGEKVIEYMEKFSSGVTGLFTDGDFSKGMDQANQAIYHEKLAEAESIGLSGAPAEFYALHRAELQDTLEYKAAYQYIADSAGIEAPRALDRVARAEKIGSSGTDDLAGKEALNQFNDLWAVSNDVSR